MRGFFQQEFAPLFQNASVPRSTTPLFKFFGLYADKWEMETFAANHYCLVFPRDQEELLKLPPVKRISEFGDLIPASLQSVSPEIIADILKFLPSETAPNNTGKLLHRL